MTSPVRSRLPAFGALCSRAASAAGLDPRAFASKRQRAWSASAERVFEALAGAGARFERVDFIAHDDRPAMRWLDRLLDRALGSGTITFAEPALLATCVASYQVAQPAAGAPSIHAFLSAIISSRHTPWDDLFWLRARAAFGSDEAARAFVLGHEAGHALFAQDHLRPVKEALIATGSELGERSAALLEASICQPQDQSHPHELALADAVQEAMCDAIGCWSAARAGCPDAIERAIDLRSSHPSASPAYRTAWMLEAIAPSIGAPLLSELREAVIRACALHGPALASRFGPPEPQAPSAPPRALC